MQRAPLFISSSCVAAALCIVGFASALAATPAPRADAAEVAARYQRDRAACLSGRSTEDQATCLKEAGAVRAEGLRGLDLNRDAADLRRNQLERCKVFVDEKESRACRLRVEQGAVSGSVREGGILRELKIVEPAPAP